MLSVRKAWLYVGGHLILRIGWVALLLMLVALVCGQDAGIVKEIEVHENVHVSKEAILSSMSTKVGSVYSQAKLDADQQTLQDLGFFSSVSLKGVSIAGGWHVDVFVAEYPAIKEIRVSGNTVLGSEQIIKALAPQFKVGSVFNERQSRIAADAVQKLYSDRGYFAQVANIGPLPDSPETLDVEIVETRVGTVSVEGNKLTKDWVMRRLIKTRSGELFSSRKWSDDLRRMYNTQWFESVRSLEDPQLGTIDLTADVKEQRTGTFNVGLQLDPESSLGGILRYSQANINGTGQTVSVDFIQTITGGGPSVSIDYTNPFIDNQDTVLRTSIYSRLVYRFSGDLFGGTNILSSTTASEYEERHSGASLGFQRPVTNNTSVGASVRAEYVGTVGLSNLVDNEQTPNDPTNQQMSNNFIQQDGPLVMGTLGITRNRRDVDLDPSRGDYFQLTFEPGVADITKVGGLTTGAGILGTHLFTRTTADYRIYWTPDKPRGRNLDEPKRVVAFRARYGVTDGTVPFFEQYFAGGSDTLRGYPDDRFWGRYTLLTNLEVRIPLQKTFSIIGFVDYGGAWGGYGNIEGYDQTDFFRLHLGYGPGISFKAGPLGNIQLFLGFNENGGTQTHFLIGNSF
jgi:outer membrane protein insertion porin family